MGIARTLGRGLLGNKAVAGQTTAGFRDAVRELWAELRLQQRHFAAVRKARAMALPPDLKLHLGCGPNVKAGWLNVDSYTPNADLRLDLREKLPFPDACATFVFSEHFFEHLEYPQPAQQFLAECFRVLKPGAVLSIGVPDTEWPVVSYGSGDMAVFELAKARFHPAWCTTRMHHLNYHFRQGREHKYAYDLETLQALLEQAGFTGVERRSFVPGLDAEARKVESLPRKTSGLYVDCRKPEAAPGQQRS